jgi:hypothetical protein
MEDPTVLMCVRVLDAKPSQIVPGATEDRCVKCSAIVWVAPSGREIIQQKGAIIWCIPCTVSNVKNRTDNYSMMDMSATQHREMNGKTICPECLHPYKNIGFAMLKICIKCMEDGK